MEVFHLIIDVNETMKIFYDVKDQRSLFKLNHNFFPLIRKKLRVFVDKEFKKYVEKYLKREFE